MGEDLKTMNTPIIFTIIKEDQGYSACYKDGDNHIFSDGDTFEELKDNILEAVNLVMEETGTTYTIADIQFRYDLESFFAFYRVINAKALAERIGMNQSLLAQYIKGKKKPSEQQMKRILNGVHQIGKELSETTLII